ncbi:unnamed protein product [Cunninghamella echinulata]
MSVSHKFILYNNIICPFAQRVAIALKELGVDYEEVTIDLYNKPEWYVNVNPELKVPALKVDDHPTIAESLVLIELLNDLYPEKQLLPNDAIKKANGRFAIEYYSSKILPNLYGAVKNPSDKETYDKTVDEAFKRFNELLLQQSAQGPYFYGEEFSLVDIAIAPFVLRFNSLNAISHEKEFQYPSVKSSPRLANYLEAIAKRQTAVDTFIGHEKFVENIVSRYNFPLKNKI